MAIAIDAYRNVAIGIGSRCGYIAIVVSMANYPLGNQRSSIPQLGAVCLAADYHTINGIHCYAILDVLARVYVPCSQTQQT